MKRPLSAYNIFYQSERKKLQEERRASFQDMVQNSASTESFKALNKMGFVDLARHVALKWSTLDKESKAYYETLARHELLRYDEEMLRRQEVGSQKRLFSSNTATENSNNTPLSPNREGHMEHSIDGNIDVNSGSEKRVRDDNRLLYDGPSPSWLLTASLPDRNTNLSTHWSSERQTSMSLPPVTTAGALQNALDFMPLFPKFEAASMRTATNLQWIDHSKTPSHLQLSLQERQPSWHASLQLILLEQLSSEMDEEEQEYLISCFSTPKKTRK